ncbi:MAG: deoxyribose-phosphate aldolase [Candidatus Kapabacteria bacterium]|nr:deoxyribose-phosphate aldolase [Candidatus Kapabacteria bacterium]
MNITIDHTLLKPDTTATQISTLCAEAREHAFASVCVLPTYVHQANELLDGSNVAVCTVIGFPLGATYGMVKAHEAKEAIVRGATEVDMVMNIADLKNGNFNDVLFDIEEVVEQAHSLGALVKVIIETCLLTDDEKKRASEIVTTSQADFIKTSTGFSTGGATVEDVVLLRASIGKYVRIKASGGIRTPEFAMQLIEAGASRLGTSSGVQLVHGVSAKSSY